MRYLVFFLFLCSPSFAAYNQYTGTLPVANGGTGQTSTGGTSVTSPSYWFGDSLTQGAESTNGGPPGAFQTATNTITYNQGIGGQISTQIAQREGGVAFTLTVASNQLVVGSNSITAINGVSPASCSVGCSGEPLSTSADIATRSLTGTLCTYHGALSRTASGGPPSTSETYTFTPDFASGGPFACTANSTFTPDFASQVANYPLIVWEGRNNYASVAQVESDIAATVALSSGNYVVLSILNADYEYAGTGSYTTISGLNSYLAGLYGSKYLNVRSYLVSNYTPSNLVDAYEVAQGMDVVPYTLHGYVSTGTLSGAIASTSTCTFTLSGAASTYGVVSVDSEYIYVSASSGSNVTACTRGYAGSTAATHLNSAAYTMSDPVHLNNTGYALVSSYVRNNAQFFSNVITSAVSGKNSILSIIPPADTTLTSIGLGGNAFSSLTAKGSYYSTALGTYALSTENSALAVQNTALGFNAMRYNTVGANNVAVGNNALVNNTTGTNNVSIGVNALSVNQTGSSNVAIGQQALNNATSSNNVAIGNVALYLLAGGGNNVAVGQCLTAEVSGSQNVCSGVYSLAAATSSNNIAIGYKAGVNVSSGGNNTILGSSVGYNPTTGANNILIGVGSSGAGGADTPATGTNYWLSIGSTLVGNMTYLTSGALSSCGTSPTIVAQSNDIKGTFTIGSAATTCTLTFTTAKSAAPSCVVTARGGVAPTYSTSTSALTLSVGVASSTYDYFCSGY